MQVSISYIMRVPIYMFIILITCGCNKNSTDSNATTHYQNDSLTGNEMDPNISFVQLSAAEFTFGSPEDRPCRAPIIEIQTPVKLTRSFIMAETELTQQQWEALGLPNPSQNIGPEKPVTFVNFYEALVWCNKLSRLEGLEPCYDLSSCENAVGTGCGPDEKFPDEGCLNPDVNFNCLAEIHRYSDYYACPGYRLPTTAEWEYAAKAGTTTHTYNGDVHYVPLGECEEEPALEDIAWYCHNSGGELHSVKQKQANPWGLYDMLGNVFEWTDFWSDGQSLSGNNTLSETQLVDPQGPTTGHSKDIRGGYFKTTGCYTSPTWQSGSTPVQRASAIGFRPVRTVFDDEASTDAD